MCPGTLALIGAGLGAAKSIGGGIASANAASYQAAVARNNAITAQQNAAYSASAGSALINQQERKSAEKEGNLRASLAASGVDVNSGTAADLQVGQRQTDALDAATVANRAAEQVYGYQTQATSFSAQSQMDQAQVPWDIAGGFIGAGADLAGNPKVDSSLKSLLSGPPKAPASFPWTPNTSSANWDGTADETGPGG